MATREGGRLRFQHEQQLKTRLGLATTRLREAGQERIWALVAAYDAGLSIRQTAPMIGLSRSRSSQLLKDDAACEMATWLTPLRARDHASAGKADTRSSSSQWMAWRMFWRHCSWKAVMHGNEDRLNVKMVVQGSQSTLD